VGLQGEVGDNNAARSVLPDAAVTTALVGSSLSILRARHTSNLVLLPRWKVRGILYRIAKGCTKPYLSKSSKVC